LERSKIGMVFDFFRRGGDLAHAAPETKKSATGKVVALAAGGGRVAWTPRDTGSLIRAAFLGNPVGFRCVKMIAEAAAALPLVMDAGGQRQITHPLLSLIAQPNPAQGRAELFEALYGQILLTGNGYVEAVSAETGAPLELHILRSDRMSVLPGSDGWPVAYDYAVGGRKHRFDVTGERPPICHVKSFHPQDDHYGMSPLQAAATAVDVHNSATRWSKALLDNAARPSGAIVYKGADGQGLSSDQYDRLVSEPMGFSPSDMEFQKTKEAAAREIALAFGVPPMLLGIPGDATFANYQEANRAFYRLTVLPLAQRVTAALVDWLGLYTEERIELRPDLDQVAALAAEREALWSRVSAADFLTATEKRRLLGLPVEAIDG
jgi:phage portal protein BeeE